MSGWDRQNLQRETYAKVDWTASKTFSVYLPAGAQWYDYWTNAKLNGGQTITASAPLSHSPLYIKAGSILPLGPDIQYANENKFDNIDLVVYPGANATFTLYEDEGDNYNYEKGQYSTIQLTWNDRSKTLTIGKREGSFPGMIATRTFNVKVIGGTQKSVTYSGKALTIK
jgi:alpha-D-xyloside xylohydrolase